MDGTGGDADKESRETYRYISTGFTDSVFQLDSYIGKSVARDVRPSNLSELALTISLNRPGPMRSGITDQVRNLKIQNRKKYDIDIFNETYGLPLYQEQIMKVAMDLAGFSSVEADAIRKPISRKIFLNKICMKGESKLIALYGNDGRNFQIVYWPLENTHSISHTQLHMHI